MAVKPTVEEFVLAALLSHQNYSSLEYVCATLHHETPNNYEFMKAVPVVEAALDFLVRMSTSFYLGQEANQEKVLYVSSDCCWNSRNYKSSMGTVSVLGMSTNKIVGVHSMVNRTSAANYQGNAKSMERAGTLKIMLDYKSAGYKVGAFLHDGDSSAMNSVREVFPECKELRCINHVIKNIIKEFKKKSGNNTHTDSCRKFLYGVFNEASGDKNPDIALHSGLERFLRHYSGDHKSCIHSPTYTQKDALSAEEIQILQILLSNISKNANLFSHGLNQSLCESFNHVISTYAPKNIYAPLLYRSRVLFAVLISNEGHFVAVPKILSCIGVTLSQSLLHFLKLKQATKEYAALNYQNYEKKRRQERLATKYPTSRHKYKENVVVEKKKMCVLTIAVVLQLVLIENNSFTQPQMTPYRYQNL